MILPEFAQQQLERIVEAFNTCKEDKCKQYGVTEENLSDFTWLVLPHSQREGYLLVHVLYYKEINLVSVAIREKTDGTLYTLDLGYTEFITPEKFKEDHVNKSA